MSTYNRIHLVVLDSVGIGAAPDANDFVNAAVPDGASDTLGHISKTVGLEVPNMAKLGLGNIPREVPLKTVPAEANPTGYATKLEEVSLGKDTMTGHWEIMGLNITEPFDTFWDGFPEEILTKIEEFSGRKIIREANKPYSGTAVIDDFGPRQMETGELIVYTSAEPVLQIAAHEDVIPLDELYRICEYARSITLERPALLGRIIARPYVGEPGNFSRTANRHDYAVSPFEDTVLNKLAEAGVPESKMYSKPEFVSPVMAEKLVRGEAKKKLQDFIKSKPGKPCLVSSDDKRKDLTVQSLELLDD